MNVSFSQLVPFYSLGAPSSENNPNCMEQQWIWSPPPAVTGPTGQKRSTQDKNTYTNSYLNIV